ncbi:hypothetical protein POM88_051054 [Heracleum sosnowskyi]|uniref:Uncharacterized protein n=1 Tax=Heracleum sosnowskyi TaxID=360622 RepID=A0AAD8M3D0_9APIA|nr:hypothetical protein POM88_051054 [Heracleum sosnowskyi]
MMQVAEEKVIHTSKVTTDEVQKMINTASEDGCISCWKLHETPSVSQPDPTPELVENTVHPSKCPTLMAPKLPSDMTGTSDTARISHQRLQDLHKAYADVMLDASKEACAKVMAAETKAQWLEHELQVTKYEAVQMMVRLKKIMDDKISESKMTSRDQTSEDYKQTQFLACHPLELENDSLAAVDKENLDLNMRAEYPECLEAIQIRKLYGPVPELPSILLKSKEYNFNKNGCTHGK